MNARLRATAEALPVLIPVAVIVIGVVTGDGWLRTPGMWGLAAVVALAILRGGRRRRGRPAGSAVEDVQLDVGWIALPRLCDRLH